MKINIYCASAMKDIDVSIGKCKRLSVMLKLDNFHMCKLIKTKQWVTFRLLALANSEFFWSEIYAPDLSCAGHQLVRQIWNNQTGPWPTPLPCITCHQALQWLQHGATQPNMVPALRLHLSEAPIRPVSDWLDSLHGSSASGQDVLGRACLAAQRGLSDGRGGWRRSWLTKNAAPGREGGRGGLWIVITPWWQFLRMLDRQIKAWPFSSSMRNRSLNNDVVHVWRQNPQLPE